jgi:hypothetical protein
MKMMALKWIFCICLLGMVYPLRSQVYRLAPVKKKTDTLLLKPVLAPADDWPVVLWDEQQRSNNDRDMIFIPLEASRDAFSQLAAFQFGVLRFRERGYDGTLSQQWINGYRMINLEDGSVPWQSWNGLNEMTRSQHQQPGMGYTDLGAGGMGSVQSMDMRVTAQRKQWQMGYVLSNRTFTHKWSLAYATETSRHGWAFAFALNARYAAETYYTGVPFLGGGYACSIDKSWRKQLFSLTVMGAPQESGKQAAVSNNLRELFGSGYNPNWGYQQGRKRNAAMTSVHRPVCLLSHEYQPRAQTRLMTAVGLVYGDRKDSQVDWVQAADPRPDYYRYLPGYQTDSALAAAVTQALLDADAPGQVNWQRLYDINRQQPLVLFAGQDTLTGKQAVYLLQQKINRMMQMGITASLHTVLHKQHVLDIGFRWQWQRNHYYKIAADLLGADFRVNWNQFAEDAGPGDQVSRQFNLDEPDKIIRTGERYGYDYAAINRQSAIWIQWTHHRARIDFNQSVQLQESAILREGFVRNGLFPEASAGRSATGYWLNYLWKTGINIKFNPRNHVSVQAILETRPPSFDQLYLSPTMHGYQQPSQVSEKIQSLAMGFHHQSADWHLRFSMYDTRFSNGMDMLRFYHDGHRNFVNYAIRNVNKIHQGIEMGLRWSPSESWEYVMALAWGRYYYTGRQRVMVTQDNDASVLDQMEVYSHQYPVAGMPQLATGAALTYKKGYDFLCTVQASFWHDRWIAWNPIRRTYAMMEGLLPGTDQWHAVVDPVKLPPAWMLNLRMAYAIPVRNNRGTPGNIYVSLSLQNILNNQDIISGGYEQLRFDTVQKDPDRFPARFYYTYGFNYAFNISLRL